MAALSWLRQIASFVVEDHCRPLVEPPEPVPQPVPLPRPNALRVLTLNIWGLPHALDQAARVAGVCEILGEWDVVAMQEVARMHDVTKLVTAARKAGLQHYHFFTQGVGFPIWKHLRGTGMLIVSRYPIVDMLYKPYTINGKPHKFQHCDFMGAKGVALARIDTGTTLLDVYCSHIHARYVPEDMDDEYVAHRTLQLYELAKFVTATRSRLPGAAAVLVGDLNTWHGNLGLEMLQCVTGMHDAYASIHPDTYLQAATHNVLDNKYRENDRPPRQIDHVLFVDASKGEQGHNCFARHTPAAALGGSITHWRVTDAEIVHRKLADGVTPLSDHCGVSVTLTRCDHRDVTATPGRARVGATNSDLRADLKARLKLALPATCGGTEAGCDGPAAWAAATATPAITTTRFEAAMRRVVRDLDVGLRFVRARRGWHFVRCLVWVALFIAAAVADLPSLPARFGFSGGLLRGVAWAALLTSAVAATVEFVLLTYTTKTEEMALMEGRTQVLYDIATCKTGWESTAWQSGAASTAGAGAIGTTPPVGSNDAHVGTNGHAWVARATGPASDSRRRRPTR